MKTSILKVLITVKAILCVASFPLHHAFAGASVPPSQVIETPATLATALALTCTYEKQGQKKTRTVRLDGDTISIYFEGASLMIYKAESKLVTRKWPDGREAQWYILQKGAISNDLGLTSFTIPLKQNIDPDSTTISVESLGNSTEPYTQIDWATAKCVSLKN
jgi:hypothetical protein